MHARAQSVHATGKLHAGAALKRGWIDSNKRVLNVRLLNVERGVYLPESSQKLPRAQMALGAAGPV